MRSSANILLALLVALGLAGVAYADRSDRPLVRSSGVNAGVDLAVGSAADGAEASRERSLATGAERGFIDELLPTGVALGATLLAIVLARSAARRFGARLAGGRRPQGVVEVLARYPVARGQQVVLLKVGRRVIVAHQGGQGMQALSEFVGEAEVADILARCEEHVRATSPFSFDALLRKSDRAFDERDGVESAASPAVSARRAASRDSRAALPALMRDAEIETVDLTRVRRPGGAR
jgi:flagellar biogenesis protein FliO